MQNDRAHIELSIRHLTRTGEVTDLFGISEYVDRSEGDAFDRDLEDWTERVFDLTELSVTAFACRAEYIHDDLAAGIRASTPAVIECNIDDRLDEAGIAYDTGWFFARGGNINKLRVRRPATETREIRVRVVVCSQ